MICECENCLPIIKDLWKFDNKKPGYKITSKIDENNDTFKSILQIQNVQSIDEGKFKCSIKNMLGINKRIISLIVDLKPRDLLINIKETSVGATKQNDKIFVISDFIDVALTCIARASPVPTIKWLKNGKEIADETLELLQENIHENAGTYQCVVENLHGMASKEIQVNVKIAPVIQSSAVEAENIKIHEKKTLYCDIDGSPMPKFSWSKNSKPLEESKEYKLTREKKVLEFEGAVDSAGIYTCIGENLFGKAMKTFEIFVQSEK